MNIRTRRALLGIIILLGLLGVISLYLPQGPRVEVIRYSTFLEDLKSGRVANVILQGDTIYGVRKDKTQFKAYNPETDYTALISALVKAQVTIEGSPPRQPGLSAELLTLALGLLVVLGFVYGVLRIHRALWGPEPPSRRASRIPAIGLPPDKAATERATGSFIAVTHEGGRPQLIELQTLVDPVPTGAPYRNVRGIDAGRVARLIAVLSHHSSHPGLRGHDVFVSTVGGIEIHDPAADLPLLLALVSSRRGRPLPAHLLAFGEIDLAGEVRPVDHGEERLRLAQKQGFQTAIVPQGNVPQRALPGLSVIPVSTVDQAIAAAFAPHGTGIAA